MTDDESIELIRHSARAFAAFGVPWVAARYGIMGFWSESEIKPGSDPVLRAQHSERFWRSKHGEQVENPFSPVVEFLQSGGRFGRWEHHVLDVWCPSGTKYGIPEHALEKA